MTKLTLQFKRRFGLIAGGVLFLIFGVMGFFFEKPHVENLMSSTEEWSRLEGELERLKLMTMYQDGLQSTLRTELLSGGLFPKANAATRGSPVNASIGLAVENAPSLPVLLAASIVDEKLEVFARIDGRMVGAVIGEALGGWTVVGSNLVSVDLAYEDMIETVDIQPSQ